MTSLELDDTLRLIAWPTTSGPLKCGPGLRDRAELNPVIGKPPSVVEAPTPAESVMNFTSAMQALRDGLRVRRPHWYGVLVYRNNRVEFDVVPRGLSKTFRASGAEQSASDWVVV